MKFFWKVFFCTMFISVIFFSIGGYLLINTAFNFLIKSEIKSTFDTCDIIFYTLNNELRDDINMLILNDESLDKDEVVWKMSQNINIYQSNEKLLFSIVDTNGKVIFSSLTQNFSKDFINELSTKKRCYFFREKDNKYFIQALTPVILRGENYFIETQVDVTNVFKNEKNQYKLLIFINGVMIIVAGIITYIIIRILFRRVNALTKTIESIDYGNFKKRVKVEGNDELSVLSRTFNRMADDLQTKILQLEEESRSKERFVAAFSHELKTPLTSIIGYSDMLRSKATTVERTQSCANYIFSEGKRLENLSMRLLDLLVSKNGNLKLKKVYITEFFDEIYYFVLPQFKNLNIDFHMDVQDAVVIMEPDLMKTVFFNILDNARKSIEKDGHISINGEQNSDYYIIRISDDGCGMTEEDLSKIKEAFYMVDKSRARKQGGAGLGLSICDEIINLHGFEMFFDSELDKGTIVTVKMRGESKDAEYEK